MKFLYTFDWKATMILILFMILVASACNWPEVVGVIPGPDDPVDQPDTTDIDTTVTPVDTVGVDSIVQDCDCPPDSLHLVTSPAFIQGWTEWDFVPDSVVWTVGPLYWATYDDVTGTDLHTLLEQVWPQYTWTIFEDEDGIVVICDGTSDQFFTRQNVFSRPYIGGQPGNKYMMTFNSQTLFTGGVLTFEEHEQVLKDRPSTRGMNLRGSDLTLEQSMVLWELLLQWCECRVADPGAFPVYRADFRWGLYDPEIVGRFTERLWFAPTNFQEDPSPPGEFVRA